ncbi:hypothetical protein BHE74_00051037 [Ensete ventricosum]|nr:hypothetical protein GW17_00006118 [Ensete ventricosum]RWW43316.1 hypothetical protein BHE74_00051037 [Ensete ventricosum]RZR91141.1 hypothetical protein BHM03_00019198 [Ensete ventricosum]
MHTVVLSSSYCSSTLAATTPHAATKPQPTSLLPSSSSTIAAAFRLKIFWLPSSNRYQPPEKSQPRRHCSITAEPQLTLLLPSSSSTVAATLGYHPPLGDFTIAAPTSLPFAAFNLKIAATLFNQFI